MDRRLLFGSPIDELLERLYAQNVALADVQGPIDFMLIDIWTPMARPALELIAPSLRQGAVVICDNTQQFRDAYREYFDFIEDRRNGLRTMTLPFDGGLEFTVRAA